MRMMRPAVSVLLTLLGGILLAIGFVILWATKYTYTNDDELVAAAQSFNEAGLILALVGVLSHMVLSAMNRY